MLQNWIRLGANNHQNSDNCLAFASFAGPRPLERHPLYKLPTRGHRPRRQITVLEAQTEGVFRLYSFLAYHGLQCTDTFSGVR
jgi:hypothetical protein